MGDFLTIYQDELFGAGDQASEHIRLLFLLLVPAIGVLHPVIDDPVKTFDLVPNKLWQPEHLSDQAFELCGLAFCALHQL